MNEIGLKVLDAPDLRGEDFVIPLENRKAIVIVCRASPISFEAQRMMGHSLQFVLGWDKKNNSFYLKPHSYHVAVCSGKTWDKNWISILYALFNKVYSGDEISELVNYVTSLNPLKADSFNCDYSTLMDILKRNTSGNIIDLEKIPKIIEEDLQRCKV